jgi:predicted MFS family arabinose efflux permease
VTTVEAGSTGLTTGTVIAFVGLGSLIGALLAPTAKKRLSLRQVVVMFTWVCTVMVASMALTRSIPVLAVLVGASALLVPALNVILSSAQALLTPDALQGRVQAATSFIALSISPLGVAGAGFLLARWRPAVAFLVFAGAILVLAVVSTASSSLRNVTGTPAKEPAVPVPGLAERT